MGKKIGILTYHHVINEGAVLQALSVAKILTKLFPSDRVEIIDYRHQAVESSYFKSSFFMSRNPIAFIAKAKRFFLIKSFIKKNLPKSSGKLTSNSYMASVQYLKQFNYDVLFVGSDEVWKKDHGATARPLPNIYWLSKDIKATKIAFSASANKLLREDLTSAEVSWVRQRLSDFSMISVRDKHTFDLISDLCPDCAPRLVKTHDPTFLLEVEEPNKNFYKKRGINFDKKIVGITFCDKRFNDELVGYLKNSGYQVVAMTAFNPRADINLAGHLTPMQWAETYRLFDLCVTNLFHGSVFSIKARCPFVSVDYFDGHGFETKMEDLLESLNLTKHYLSAKSVVQNPSCLYQKISEIIEANNGSELFKCEKAAQDSLNVFLNKAKRIVEANL